MCAATMTTILIHCSPIHRKWVKALGLLDAQAEHGKILHLSSCRIHSRNGCFLELVKTVAVPNGSEVDWNDGNDRVPNEVHKEFREVGEELKASISRN
jgi:hypothetical protein